eukprot:4709248-Pleurochrysis_carterae.AAC.1
MTAKASGTVPPPRSLAWSRPRSRGSRLVKSPESTARQAVHTPTPTPTPHAAPSHAPVKMRQPRRCDLAALEPSALPLAPSSQMANPAAQVAANPAVEAGNTA